MMLSEPREVKLKDFFVSFNKADRRWAEWIAWQLEAAGYTVIFQNWDFAPGGNFVLNMHQAVENSERTIAVLSTDFLQSAFTQPEWAAALAKDPTGRHQKLVPVRVRECEPDGLLGQINYLDFVSIDEAAARTRLLNAAGKIRGKPPIEPDFPGESQDASAAKPRFPGTRPPIWYVPHSRNPNFAGRSTVISGLRDELRSGTPAAMTQAISGLGGIGKTQLAIEYAYRYSADYKLVWWIRAEEADSRNADILDLAATLKVSPPGDSDPAANARAVLRWLDGNRDWLLIFDNVEEPGDIESLLPKGGTGHVLITSRHRAWSNIAKTVTLAVWSVEESVEYILHRTAQPDGEAARTLAQALGCLPLALEQAAAYIEESGVSIAEYTSMFERHHLRLLKDEGGQEARVTVATIWELSLQKVGRANQAAVAMLQLLAFLPPDRISRRALIQGAKSFPPALSSAAADEVTFNDAVAVLRRYSLIEASSEHLTIHRLVQLVVQKRLGNHEFRVFSEAANRFQHGEEYSEPVSEKATERGIVDIFNMRELDNKKKRIIISSIAVIVAGLSAGVMFYRSSGFGVKKVDIVLAELVFEDSVRDEPRTDIAAVISNTDQDLAVVNSLVHCVEDDLSKGVKNAVNTWVLRAEGPIAIAKGQSIHVDFVDVILLPIAWDTPDLARAQWTGGGSVVPRHTCRFTYFDDLAVHQAAFTRPQVILGKLKSTSGR